MELKKVLVVDDDRFLVDLLVDKFNKSGYLTEFAYDGTTALDKVSNNKYDLILLDLLMPDVNGIAVVKKLKSQANTKDTPVLILTNLSDDEAVAQIKKSGGSGYLIKNEHSIDAIIEAAKNLL